MLFKDVDPKDPGFTDIGFVSDEGIMVGGDGYFRPTDPVTRVELAHVTARILSRMGIKPKAQTLPDPDRLSDHFRRHEFACRCCGTGGDKMDPKLIFLMEKLRIILGQPIYITSGYRCPAHNKAVGGAASSYHMKGMAADITVPKLSPFDVARAAEVLGFGGIGTYTTGQNYFTHVDIGPRRKWSD